MRSTKRVVINAARGASWRAEIGRNVNRGLPSTLPTVRLIGKIDPGTTPFLEKLVPSGTGQRRNRY